LQEGFSAWLQLERGFSGNTLEAYQHDLDRLRQWAQLVGASGDPRTYTPETLSNFVADLAEMGFTPGTQARIISGLRTFYRYLLLDRQISQQPMQHIRLPRNPRKIPVYLTPDEIETLIAQIDLSAPRALRDLAIVETLYSCGLRISELLGLRLQDIQADESLLLVTGKGNKQRLVPIGKPALRQLLLYIRDVRSLEPVKPKAKDLVFLNRFGGGLSRVSVFTMIKDLTARAGIRKNVSPHTFRHSFATALVEAGADLRAVQDLLGHESITTTEIYAHLDTDYLRSTLMQFHPASRRSRK
jgi:integrase/recombinase XerD